MAPSELDSFYFKFKNLLFAEKNATLSLKSEAGRVQVTLCADLGHVLSGLDPHLPHDARNGTSRSRRRERAEARIIAAGQVDKVDKSTSTEIPEEVISAETEEVTDAAANVDQDIDVTESCGIEIGKVSDEICSDEQYERKVDDSEEEFREVYSFKSDTAEEEIEQCLDDILKNCNIKRKKIIHRDQIGSRSTTHLYTLELKIGKGKLQKTSFSWPKMSNLKKEVFQNLKRII